MTRTLALIVLVVLCGCTNRKHEALQNSVHAAMLKESGLMMESLDKSLNYLHNNEMEKFWDEWDKMIEHQYTKDLLFDIWIADVIGNF